MSFPSSDPFVNEDTLWTLFAQFGDIEDLVVDEKPSKSKICEGQVVFQRFYAIEACVKAKPLKIDTTPIDIRRTEEKVCIWIRYLNETFKHPQRHTSTQG